MSNYRPIYILPTLSKYLRRLWPVESWIMLKKIPYYRVNFGFMAGVSTSDANMYRVIYLGRGCQLVTLSCTVLFTYVGGVN